MGAWTYYVYFFSQYTVYVVSDRNKYFDYFSQRLSERGGFGQHLLLLMQESNLVLVLECPDILSLNTDL